MIVLYKKKRKKSILEISPRGQYIKEFGSTFSLSKENCEALISLFPQIDNETYLPLK